MAVVLDTHAFLWWTQNDARLSARPVESPCCLSNSTMTPLLTGMA
jgi:hypothetical protein